LCKKYSNAKQSYKTYQKRQTKKQNRRAKAFGRAASLHKNSRAVLRLRLFLFRSRRAIRSITFALHTRISGAPHFALRWFRYYPSRKSHCRTRGATWCDTGFARLVVSNNANTGFKYFFIVFAPDVETGHALSLQ